MSDNIFGNVTTEGLQPEEDRLGGYQLLDTALYPGVIQMAYVQDSASSDARAVVTIVKYGEHDMEERVWVLNGKGENTYTRGDKKFALPGFELINAMCICATGVGLTEQDIETKTIEIWDSESRSKKPKSVPVITSLLQKPVTGAIVRQTVNKQAKNESTGKWEDINEQREENVTDKYFHTETGLTAAEAIKIKGGTEIPEDKRFMGLWDAKNTGNTRNKFKAVSGTAGPATSGSGSPKKSDSLFG